MCSLIKNCVKYKYLINIFLDKLHKAKYNYYKT